MAPDKGLHLLLPGFAALLATRPDARLTIVAGPGRAWYRIYCERLVRRLGVAHAVDWQPAVPRDSLDELCRGYGALLHYSRNDEPVALTLLHAVAAGLPVITSRPPRPGAIVVDGRTCLCYDAERPESIARATARLLDDDAVRAQVVAEAFATASRTCAIDTMTSDWDRLLQELLP
jgi:glycosyltransferase involved in cell wall biosynthesis